MSNYLKNSVKIIKIVKIYLYTFFSFITYFVFNYLVKANLIKRKKTRFLSSLN